MPKPINWKCSLDYECRYCYPWRKKCHTVIDNATPFPIKWFAWIGSETEHHIKEINLQWNAYDAFQNDHCPSLAIPNLHVIQTFQELCLVQSVNINSSTMSRELRMMTLRHTHELLMPRAEQCLVTQMNPPIMTQSNQWP
jgi:hypothetical protein